MSESLAAIRPASRSHGYPRLFQILATCSRRHEYHKPSRWHVEDALSGTISNRKSHARAPRPNSLVCSSHPRKYSSASNAAVAEVPSTNSTDSAADHRQATQSEGSEADIPVGQQVRKLMRHVGHPVGIVTSVMTDREENVGATISSFNTVSLEPETVVSIHLRLPSATFDAIEGSNTFNLHIMREGDESSSLATLFTKGNGIAGFRLLEKDRDYVPGTLSSKAGPIGPLLGGSGVRSSSQLALGVLECKYLPALTVRIGEVAVVFGSVRRLHGYDQLAHPEVGNRSLVYVDGTYSNVKKHHETSEAQLVELRNVVETLRAVQDGVQRVANDVANRLSAGTDDLTPALVQENLGRLRHSLNSSKMFHDEIIKPFLDGNVGDKPQNASRPGHKSPLFQKATGTPSQTRSFSTLRGNAQAHEENYVPLIVARARQKSRKREAEKAEMASSYLKGRVQRKSLLRWPTAQT